MAILSFSPAPAKGASSTATLNKSELYALAPISGDAFWSVVTNIQQITAVYQSTVGGQNKVLNFDPSQASPTDSISFSTHARDNFELKHIMLRDFDGGELMLSRATLSGLITIGDLDIAVSSGAGSLIFNSFADPIDNRERVRLYGGGFNLTSAEGTYSVGELQRFTMSGPSAYIDKVAIGAWLGNQFGDPNMTGASFKFALYEMNGENLATYGGMLMPFYSNSRAYSSLILAGVEETNSPSGDGTEVEFTFTGILLNQGTTYALGLVVEVASSALGPSYGASMYVAHRAPASGMGGIFNNSQYGSIPATPNYRLKIYTA